MPADREKSLLGSDERLNAGEFKGNTDSVLDRLTVPIGSPAAKECIRIYKRIARLFYDDINIIILDHVLDGFLEREYVTLPELCERCKLAEKQARKGIERLVGEGLILTEQIKNKQNPRARKPQTAYFTNYLDMIDGLSWKFFQILSRLTKAAGGGMRSNATGGDYFCPDKECPMYLEPIPLMDMVFLAKKYPELRRGSEILCQRCEQEGRESVMSNSTKELEEAGEAVSKKMRFNNAMQPIQEHLERVKELVHEERMRMKDREEKEARRKNHDLGDDDSTYKVHNIHIPGRDEKEGAAADAGHDDTGAQGRGFMPSHLRARAPPKTEEPPKKRRKTAAAPVVDLLSPDKPPGPSVVDLSSPSPPPTNDAQPASKTNDALVEIDLGDDFDMDDGLFADSPEGTPTGTFGGPPEPAPIPVPEPAADDSADPWLTVAGVRMRLSQIDPDVECDNMTAEEYEKFCDLDGDLMM